MAIKLRANTATNTGKGSELTYLEMDTNLESFYYSSSLAGGNLTLFTTGSISHSINLGSATGAQGAPGNNGNNGAQGAEGAQGAPGNVAAQGAQGAPGNNGAQGAPGNNGNNGAQGAEGAQGAPGAGGTPSGSNTHIQFNRLGNFGGDAGLTYASASQILTVDKSTAPTAASPNILLLGNSSTAGALSGVIAGSATVANTSPASIQFKNAVTHGLGDFGTDVLIKTAFSDGLGTTVERTAATFTASGDTHFGYDIFAPNLDNTVQNNVVGFNSTTGKLTYFATPGSFTRPTSATSVVFDVDVNAGWTNLATASGPNPTSAGQFTTDSSTPASVSQIKINKTANSSVDQSSQLEDLAVSSSLTITQAGGGAGFGTYRIVTKTDNTSYMTYNVTVASSTGGTFTNTAISTIDTLGTGEYEYVLSSGYNLLDITNNGSNSNTLRLKVPINSATGNRVLAETQINASSPTNVFITYQARSGSVSSTGQVNKPLYTIGSSGTATTVVLDTSDVAVLEFTTWGTSSAVTYGLLPVGAVQVYNG